MRQEIRGEMIVSSSLNDLRVSIGHRDTARRSTSCEIRIRSRSRSLEMVPMCRADKSSWWRNVPCFVSVNGKLESLGYNSVLVAWCWADTIHVWQTDRRTDRHHNICICLARKNGIGLNCRTYQRDVNSLVIACCFDKTTAEWVRSAEKIVLA